MRYAYWDFNSLISDYYYYKNDHILTGRALFLVKYIHVKLCF